MVRSLAVGFGLVTVLAVAGSMTPAGQGMLGQRHSPEKVVPVTSIQDRPAVIPGPAQSLVTPPAAQQAAPVPASAAPRSPAPSAAARSPQAAPRSQAPTPRSQQSAQAGQPGPPQQNGPGGIAGIANILLNLPQVLDRTQVGPSRGNDSWSQSDSPDQGSGPYKKKRRVRHEESKESGDGN